MANVEIEGPGNFHLAYLPNGKAIVLLMVACMACHTSAGFKVVYIFVFPF